MTLIQCFLSVSDPRTGPAKKYNLQEILFSALCAILSGADDWHEIADWTEDYLPWLRQFSPFPAGAPSHDTYTRVFRIIDANAFEQCFRHWIASLVGVVEGVLAMDGKTIRGSHDGRKSALHTVSAYLTQSGLCLAQESVRGRGQEIKQIGALLEVLTLKGCIVTIDAIGCQTSIAKKITERGGDYLLAVKGNQGKLFEQVEEFFRDGENGFGDLVVSRGETTEKDHGRIEQRKGVWISDLSFLPETMRERWEGLSGVGMLERLRITKGKESIERVYYLGSRAIVSGDKLLEVARAHWGIENGLHRTLDVSFAEDESRVRKDNAPQNLATMRKFALSALKQDERYPKMSIKRRRKKMSRDEGYLASLLGLITKP